MNLHKTLSNFSPLPSRRALVTGALAGGFVLAFRLPVKAANEPEQPPDNPAGPVRAQCLHPHRSCRQDHAGDAAGGDGPGRLYRRRHDPRRRARCRFHRGDAGACAAQRQALRQSHLRHSGHRQFQFHSLVLETVARRRRRGAGDAGAGRRRPMAGRSGELLRVERQGHARRERARAGLRRSGRCRERRSGAAESAAQRSKRLYADRQAAQAARYAEQDRRQGRLRHRRACCPG